MLNTSLTFLKSTYYSTFAVELKGGGFLIIFLGIMKKPYQNLDDNST